MKWKQFDFLVEEDKFEKKTKKKKKTEKEREEEEEEEEEEEGEKGNQFHLERPSWTVKTSRIGNNKERREKAYGNLQ